MKKEEALKLTTHRRTEKIIRTVDPDPYSDGCSICPMFDHCFKHKHKMCKPQRIRERNWKSQRRTQWKKQEKKKTQLLKNVGN